MITVHELEKRITVPLSLSKHAIVDHLAKEIGKAVHEGAITGMESAVRDCINTLKFYDYNEKCGLASVDCGCSGGPYLYDAQAPPKERERRCPSVVNREGFKGQCQLSEGLTP